MKQKGENGNLLASRIFREEVRETRIPLMGGFSADGFSTAQKISCHCFNIKLHIRKRETESEVRPQDGNGPEETSVILAVEKVGVVPPSALFSLHGEIKAL